MTIAFEHDVRFRLPEHATNPERPYDASGPKRLYTVQAGKHSGFDIVMHCRGNSLLDARTLKRKCTLQCNSSVSKLALSITSQAWSATAISCACCQSPVKHGSLGGHTCQAQFRVIRVKRAVRAVRHAVEYMSGHQVFAFLGQLRHGRHELDVRCTFALP